MTWCDVSFDESPRQRLHRAHPVPAGSQVPPPAVSNAVGSRLQADVPALTPDAPDQAAHAADRGPLRPLSPAACQGPRSTLPPDTDAASTTHRAAHRARRAPFRT